MTLPAYVTDRQPASFRGVPFYVDRHGYESGRRGPDHQYIERDETISADTGQAPETIDLEGYVAGDDAHRQARRIRDAFVGESGPGWLVHPYFGRLYCQNRKLRIDFDDLNSQGLIPFRASLVVTGAGQWPEGAATEAKAKSAADALKDAADADFADGFDASSYDAQAATRAVQDATARLAEMREAVSGPVRDALGEAASFATAATSFGAQLDALVADPAALASKMRGLYEEVTSLDALARIVSHAGRIVGVPSGLAPAAEAELANRNALDRLGQAHALARATELAADTEWSVADDAIATRNAFAVAYRGEMGATLQLDSLIALVDGRGALVADIDARAAGLARLVDFEVVRPTNVFDLAWQLYADANRVGELLDLNPAIVSPLVVPPGTYRVADR